MNRSLGAAVKAGVALASLLMALLVAELVLSAVGFPDESLEIELGQAADTRLYHAFEDRHFVYDSDLIWKPKPASEVFNSQGFRGPVIEVGESPSCYRIFALGDSNTLGWAGKDGAHWPGFLGQLLGSAKSCRVVVNAGVYGYSSYQGLLRLREVLRYRPDLVLLSYGSNDAHPVTIGDRELAPERKGLLKHAARRFKLGRLAASAWRQAKFRGRDLRPRVSLDEYRTNLLDSIRLCREHGAEPVLLTRPYSGRLRSAEPKWKSAAHRYNEITLEVGRSTGIQVVDVYSMFKGMDEFFGDESHFTEAGHRLLAEILVAVLDQLGVSPVGGAA